MGSRSRVARPARAYLALAGTVLAAILGASPTTARAYEDELTLGMAAGYAWNVAADDAVGRHGAAVALSVSGGVGDVLALQGFASYAAHPRAGATTHVVAGGVELVYLLDILELVPFFGLGVDAVGSVLDGDGTVELGAHGILGLDYLPSFEWIVGVDVRVFVLPLATGGGRLDTVYGQVLFRVTRRFFL